MRGASGKVALVVGVIVAGTMAIGHIPANAGRGAHFAHAAASPGASRRRPTPEALALGIKIAGTEIYLTDGKSRLLLLQGWGTPSGLRPGVTWDHGHEVRIRMGRLLVLRRGKQIGSISLKDLHDRWLYDDAVWTNHAMANEARYLDHGGGNMGMDLTEAIPVRGGLLGVINWQPLDSVGESLYAQHLVRLTFAPEPDIHVVRLLAPIRPDVFGAYRGYYGPRLFRLHGAPALYTPAGLQPLTTSGKPTGRIIPLPKELYPWGIVADRWAVV
ncbi:MAG TPA: hypothetical protein VFJ58_02165 [Armatimonadota bacterium]|nr:hypothetical protein [Armatimonadota bacterium]